MYERSDLGIEDGPYLQASPNIQRKWRSRLRHSRQRVDVSGIAMAAALQKGFIFDPEIASFIHQLWQDLVIPKIMDCISEFYLMDSAS